MPRGRLPVCSLPSILPLAPSRMCTTPRSSLTNTSSGPGFGVAWQPASSRPRHRKSQMDFIRPVDAPLRLKVQRSAELVLFLGDDHGPLHLALLGGVIARANRRLVLDRLCGRVVEARVGAIVEQPLFAT